MKFEKTIRCSIIAPILVAILSMSITESVQAQKREFAPTIGLEIDIVEEITVGAVFRIPLSKEPLTIAPYGNYYLGIDNGSLIELGANLLYGFGVDNQTFDFYSGLGLGLVRSSFDRNRNQEDVFKDKASSEMGLNVVGGAIYKAGNMRPFVELRVMLGSADLVNVTSGLLFSF